MAVMGHVASSEKNCCHDKCPKGSESWCKYQADKQMGRGFINQAMVLIQPL